MTTRTMVERLGRDLAAKSTHVWAYHAVVLTKGGAVQASGANVDGRHAEKSAIYHLPRRATGEVSAAGMTLWSMRINKTGTFGMALPCPACMEILRMAGCRCVMFTTPEGWASMRVVREE